MFDLLRRAFAMGIPDTSQAQFTAQLFGADVLRRRIRPGGSPIMGHGADLRPGEVEGQPKAMGAEGLVAAWAWFTVLLIT